MPSLAALSFLPLALFAAGSQRPPKDALAHETYKMVTVPGALPAEVQTALARHLGQDRLHIAAAGEPFASTDEVMDPSLPGRRLIAAAVGPKYAVVHYEQGGIAHTRHVVVFERAAAGVTEVWSGSVQRTYEAQEFERALHSGALWEKPVSR
jgi:hypothetical protein